MEIMTLQEKSEISAFEAFLNSISKELAANICKKLQAYSQANDIHPSSRLKVLKPKIWGYKGTIYKLRVDCGKESARILFAKSPGNDLVLLHGFVKKTQKTPRKDAKIAMEKYEQLKGKIGVRRLPMEKYVL